MSPVLLRLISGPLAAVACIAVSGNAAVAASLGGPTAMEIVTFSPPPGDAAASRAKPRRDGSGKRGFFDSKGVQPMRETCTFSFDALCEHSLPELNQGVFRSMYRFDISDDAQGAPRDSDVGLNPDADMVPFGFESALPGVD